MKRSAKQRFNRALRKARERGLEEFWAKERLDIISMAKHAGRPRAATKHTSKIAAGYLAARSGQ